MFVILARDVKSYIKDTNDFLKKLRSLTNLPSDIILCSVDVVGLYPNIPHDECLSALQKRLELRREEKVSTSMLVELAELLLKNNDFIFGKKTLKQLRGTAIGPKLAPPYSILFMVELEEEILREVELKLYLWWRYIDDIFFIWEHDRICSDSIYFDRICNNLERWLLKRGYKEKEVRKQVLRGRAIC